MFVCSYQVIEFQLENVEQLEFLLEFEENHKVSSRHYLRTFADTN